MTDAERVYSLYVQTNPVPDPGLLPLTRGETELLIIEGSRDMDTQERVDISPGLRKPRRRVAAVAFVAVLVVVGAVVGIAALVGDGDEVVVVAAGDARPEVTFDGESCTYDGPSVIEGGVLEFTLVNTSDVDVSIAAWRVRDPAQVELELAELPVGGDMALAPADPLPDAALGMGFDAPAGDSTTWSGFVSTGTLLIDCVRSSSGFRDHAWRPATIEVVVP